MPDQLLKSPRFHAAVTAAIFFLAVIVTLLMDHEEVSLLFTIFVCGAGGGFVSTYVRLRKMPIDEVSVLQGPSNTIAILQVYIGPIVGGGFALVLYALTMAGLVGGDLFPKFEHMNNEYKGVVELFKGVGPATQADAVKALVWGFIAGFGEMFVPNILDRIITDAEKQDV